jgi:hypothetical protein
LMMIFGLGYGLMMYLMLSLMKNLPEFKLIYLEMNWLRLREGLMMSLLLRLMMN